MKKLLFSPFRLIFQEAPPNKGGDKLTSAPARREKEEASPPATERKLDKLKAEVEGLPELPEKVYSFELSKYKEAEGQVDEAEKALQVRLEEADLTKDVVVTLKGTADRVPFRLEKGSRPPRVHLDKPPEWREDFRHALDELMAGGGLKEILKAYLDDKAYENFEKIVPVLGLEAIHTLPLDAQQAVLNHSIAYLRAEKLKAELEAKFGDKVKFEIETEWLKKKGGRISTVMDVAYTKKEEKREEKEPAGEEKKEEKEPAGEEKKEGGGGEKPEVQDEKAKDQPGPPPETDTDEQSSGLLGRFPLFRRSS